jgi:Family of unknown function (DUF6059)
VSGDFLVRWLKRAFEALVAFGMYWVYVPPLRPYGEGPPAGHPERLCADVPLSDLERWLVREIGSLPEVF